MATAYVNNQLTTDPDARGGKYDVEAYTYPMDLFGQFEKDPETGQDTGTQQEGTGPTKYANAWVMININVQDKSMALIPVDGDPTFNQTVDLSEAEKNRFKSTTSRPDITISRLGVAGAIAGSGFSLGEVLSNPVAATSKLTKGAALGAITAVPFAKNGIKQRSTKRMKAAIQLPMPAAVQTGYSMGWGEENTKGFDMLMRAKEIGTDAANFLAGKTGVASDAATGFVLGASDFLGSGGLSAATGLASNPKKEMIFESVNFRNFQLDYRFYPRSQAEMGRLFNIIKLLKYHMHPEFLVPSTDTNQSGMFTFIYPSEFDITFYTRQGTENPWINKVATCALTGLNVNYTPDSFWVGHDDGSPNGIQLSLTFKELSILTKEQIAGGF